MIQINIYYDRLTASITRKLNIDWMRDFKGNHQKDSSIMESLNQHQLLLLEMDMLEYNKNSIPISPIDLYIIR